MFIIISPKLFSFLFVFHISLRHVLDVSYPEVTNIHWQTDKRTNTVHIYFLLPWGDNLKWQTHRKKEIKFLKSNYKKIVILSSIRGIFLKLQTSITNDLIRYDSHRFLDSFGLFIFRFKSWDGFKHFLAPFYPLKYKAPKC